MKNIFLVQTDKPSRLVKIKDILFYTTIENIIPRGVYQHIYITSDEEIKDGEWMYNELSIGSISKATRKNIDGIKRDKEKGYTNHLYKIILTTDPDLIKDGVQAIDDEFLEWVVKNPSCEDVKWNAYPINPNGNVVATNRTYPFDGLISNFRIEYKIIIPKEEPKQYTSQELEGFEDFKKMIKPKQDEIDFMSKELDIERKRFSKQKTLEEAAENSALKHFLFPKELFFKMCKCSQNDYLLEEEFGLDNTTKYREILGFIQGAKWQAERMYSEEEVLNFTQTILMQYKFGNTNIEQIDLLKETLEQFKKK
jgi:hypothetical protein